MRDADRLPLAGAADVTVATREEFVRRGILAGGAAAAAAVLLAGLPKLAASAPSRKQDERIFRFILDLERLKAAFYGDAAERGEVGDELLRLAQVLSEQPGRVSHGCIRMRNEDILRLARLMPVGTPLTIR